jgi:hypothetical protein
MSDSTSIPRTTITTNHFLLKVDRLTHFKSNGIDGSVDMYMIDMAEGIHRQWVKGSSGRLLPVEEVREVWHGLVRAGWRVTYENDVLAMGQWP